jgi:hypothetical protein
MGLSYKKVAKSVASLPELPYYDTCIFIISVRVFTGFMLELRIIFWLLKALKIYVAEIYLFFTRYVVHQKLIMRLIN